MFQTVFGVCLFLGSWFTGWLYDRSLYVMVLFSAGVQILAALEFLRIGRMKSAG